MRPSRWLIAAAFAARCFAQNPADMRQILERLERLEEQNRELLTEIRQLRAQVDQTHETAAAPAGVEQANPQPKATLEERVELNERRIAELDQSKVGADHKLPVQLTGMLLFNAFANGRNSGGQMDPTTASATAGAQTNGATIRQTVLGLKYDGPEIFGGGKVDGTVYMDFFAGTGSALDQQMRLRIATLNFSWKNTTLTFGQDKPIIAPREPMSLAQVGVSPLTGAGNLWLWEPQVKIEQRFAFGESAGLNAQAGIFQTAEGANVVSPEYSSTLGRTRPGIEGRFELWGDLGNERRLEIAPGFHVSQTHIAGRSVPSRVYSVDWLVRPLRPIDFTGAFFTGENVDVLGGLRQGVNVVRERAFAVHETGGWAQFTARATGRLSFHLFAGEQDNRASQLQNGQIVRNFSYGGNVMYRFGSNVLASFETSQTRTAYLGTGTRINPHYDLALGYFF